MSHLSQGRTMTESTHKQRTGNKVQASCIGHTGCGRETGDCKNHNN